MSVNRAKLLRQHIREAARRLGVKPSDPLAKRTGVLVMTREAMADAMATQLIAGRIVDPTPYLKLEAAIGALLPPAPPAEAKVEVEIINRNRTREDLVAAGEVGGGPRPSDPPPPAAATPAGSLPTVDDVENASTVSRPTGEPKVEVKVEPPKPKGDHVDLAQHASFPAPEHAPWRNLVDVNPSLHPPLAPDPQWLITHRALYGAKPDAIQGRVAANRAKLRSDKTRL